MERIVKISRIIRNNWKKSLFAAVVASYGASVAKERYEINILMQAACKEAAKYGDSLIQIDRNPTLVTVILNPVANKRNAKTDFEKYCEPLFHLAGLQLDVVQTTSEGNAKDVTETLCGTEAIVVAGGDGTLAETVTGLLRRKDNANQFPIGVLPLGRTNTFANTMFQPGKGVDKVKQLIDASMAVIKGNTTLKAAMKVEPLPTENNETPNRPIYALSSIEWGAFRDTIAKRDKYWYLGSLREYAAYLFNGYKSSLTWDCSGTVKFTPPCPGCSHCVTTMPVVKSKWSLFLPTTQAQPSPEVENPECAVIRELCFKTCDFKIQTPNLENSSDIPALTIVLGKNSFSYTDFVAEGWSRLKGESKQDNVISVRTVELTPKETREGDVIEIDKEEFEVKPVRITLLPKVVKLFCTPEIK